MTLLRLPKPANIDFVQFSQAKKFVANNNIEKVIIWESNNEFYISFYGKSFTKSICNAAGYFKAFSTISCAYAKVISMGVSEDKILCAENPIIVLPTENTEVIAVTTKDLIDETWIHFANKNYKELALIQEKIQKIEFPKTKIDNSIVFFCFKMHLGFCSINNENNNLSLQIEADLTHYHLGEKHNSVTFFKDKIHYYCSDKVQEILQPAIEQWLNTPHSYYIKH